MNVHARRIRARRNGGVRRDPVAWVSLALIGAIGPMGSLLAQVDVVAERDQRMTELGLAHDTAESLYLYLRAEARGGAPLTPATMPDWSGLWTRDLSRGITFDPDQPSGGLPTAKLTPQFHERMLEKIELARQGIEYDPISDCRPPGHPRWLTIPFLREFVVTPDKTLLISEVVNIVRRIYTDGRDHTPPADRYPLWFGDSIGFWDQGRLVIHTNSLRQGQYTRMQPDYTDEVETVEIWELIDDQTMRVDVWVYDPPALVEPWYVTQHYARLADPDGSLRARYWHCLENSNNAITQTEQGSSNFTDFTFVEADGNESGDPDD